MTSDEQLEKWVVGESVCPNERGECCPDFSCCQPELLADERTRQVFASADEKTRMSMLGSFLGAAIFHMGIEKKVYISGADDPEKMQLH